MKVEKLKNGWRNSAPSVRSPHADTSCASCFDTLSDSNGTEATSGSRSLTDYFHSEFSSGELRLLQTLALYRRSIPQTHRGMLEHNLSARGAWIGLTSRALLVNDKKPWHMVLPSHLRSWLISTDFMSDGQETKQFHGFIASCWLEELGSFHHATTWSRTVASEALYHLSVAGDEQRLRQIPPELLCNDLERSREVLKRFYNDLFRIAAPVSRQKSLLQYRLLLDPDNHAIHRFLGQCWQKEEGKGSRKAIACFETACRLKPDYSPYWADLGQALLAAGRAGASDFLARLAEVERSCPAVINDHVRSVRIACLKLTAGSGAVITRRDEISSGSRNPVYYADEAKEQLKQGNYARALEILDLAEQRGCGTDITTAIKCTALEKTGNRLEASVLRLEKIALGSRNAALYCDEAKARLAGGDPEGALAILDLALNKDLGNDFLTAVRATALQRAGKPERATAVRMAKIRAGSRNCVFYNDEAKARMLSGDFTGAKEILELAVQYNCANQITSVLWKKLEHLSGESGACMGRKGEIGQATQLCGAQPPC